MNSMALPRPLVNAEEFLDWCGRAENAGRHFELVRGEIVEMPPPGDRHGTICSWIAHLLWSFALRRGRGRVNSNDVGLVVERDPDTTRGADILFFDENVPLAAIASKYPAQLPVLIVEVLSPSDNWTRTQLRIRQYLNLGVPLVWVLDPEMESVTVFRPNELSRLLSDSDVLTGNGVLPDFECKVSELFTLPGVMSRTN
jgi:Uma2 family endonuclease